MLGGMYGAHYHRTFYQYVWHGFAFCGNAIHPDVGGISESQSQITCPDCIQVIKACIGINDEDLALEYDSELFHMQLGLNGFLSK